MSTWRPSKNCLYVIPDIHGMYDQLHLILSRILPLRKTGNSFDQVIFLGDYIDRRSDSHKVLDTIIEMQENQPDQVICLKGNHELILEKALSPTQTVHDFNMWMGNGGDKTLYGYLRRKNSDVENPFLIPRMCIDTYIPKNHIDFIKNCLPYYEKDQYIFVHGGCDPTFPLQYQDRSILAWDRSVYNQALSLKQYNKACPWEKIVVTGHSGNTEGKIFVHDKFMMLDASPADKLYVIELNSRQCYSARKGKARLVKEKLCSQN